MRRVALRFLMFQQFSLLQMLYKSVESMAKNSIISIKFLQDNPRQLISLSNLIFFLFF